MTNRYRAGKPCQQPLPPTGEQIAKELHARYFKEMPVQMHEPGLLTKLRQFYRNLRVTVCE